MAKNGKVDVERVFVGSGCNRIVNNVSWGSSGLVSYGSQNAVTIFNPQVTFSLIILFIINLLS